MTERARTQASELSAYRAERKELLRLLEAQLGEGETPLPVGQADLALAGTYSGLIDRLLRLTENQIVDGVEIYADFGSEDSFDAWASGSDLRSDVYFILIHRGAMSKLHQIPFVLQNLALSLPVSPHPEYQSIREVPERPEHFSVLLTQILFGLLFFHELGHVLLGHLTLGSPLTEQQAREDWREGQRMEADADLFATEHMWRTQGLTFGKGVYLSSSRHPKRSVCRAMGTAVVLLGYLLHIAEGKQGQRDLEAQGRHHPDPLVRLRLILQASPLFLSDPNLLRETFLAGVATDALLSEHYEMGDSSRESYEEAERLAKDLLDEALGLRRRLSSKWLVKPGAHTG